MAHCCLPQVFMSNIHMLHGQACYHLEMVSGTPVIKIYE